MTPPLDATLALPVRRTPAPTPARPESGRRFDRSLAHRERCHAVIPGGAHTYAKGDDQYPEHMTPYIVRGAGGRVWDLDGNDYVEFGAGVRSITLGHGYAPVVEAATRAMRDGTNFARPAVIETAAAERLLDVIRGADMVKFAKNGSDATTAAVRLARAVTGRDVVLFCGDQPFFSVDDWFVGTTAMSAGCPEAIARLSAPFRYNDLAGVERLFDEYAGRVACVILEPETTEPPRDGFLHRLRDLCHARGALFVLDETITGFRWHVGGAQRVYDVVPDLSTFGKGMANGFSVSALCGRREFMERGGIRHDGERVFLLSTTHGGETHALAACMATIDACERLDVASALHRAGERLTRGVERAIDAAGVRGHFALAGRAPNLVYVTKDAAGERSQAFRTLFLQETLKRGVIAPNLVVNFSHTEADLDHAVGAIAAALRVYRKALEDGVEHHLVGRPVKPVFRRHN